VRAAHTPSRVPVVHAVRLPAFDAELIGRQDEWEVLQQAWRRLSGGQGGILVVEGAAGVGKSRLVSEFANRAKARTFRKRRHED